MSSDDDKTELWITPLIKCSDCGFLAIRHRFNRLLREAEDTFRQSAQLPPVGEGMEYEPQPLCSKGAFDIRKEIKGDSKDDTLEAINRGRRCEAFTDWRPGYSPREHQQMLDEKWKREQEAAQRREMNEFQAKQSALADRRHQESLRSSMFTSLLAAALGAGATLLAVKVGTPPQPIINVVVPNSADREQKPAIQENDQNPPKHPA